MGEVQDQDKGEGVSLSHNVAKVMVGVMVGGG